MNGVVAGRRAEASDAAPAAADPDGAAVGAVLPRHRRLLAPPPHAQRALAHAAAPGGGIKPAWTQLLI
jgi:hypothetical protein